MLPSGIKVTEEHCMVHDMQQLALYTTHNARSTPCPSDSQSAPDSFDSKYKGCKSVSGRRSVV